MAKYACDVRRLIGPSGRTWAQLLLCIQGDALSWTRSVPRGLAAPCLLLLLALVGCSTNDRTAASGTVTLDDKPLESGAISFQPTRGSEGPSAGGRIINGQYQLAAKHGLKPGNYSVTIQTFKPTGRMLTDRQTGKNYPEQAQVTYNEAGKLEAAVVAGVANRFDFTLTSAGGAR
jgi:hypothetical protein